MSDDVEDYAHMKRSPSKPMADLAGTQEDYPYGLRLCLTHEDLQKLGLDMPVVGDTVHIMAMCKVVSAHAHDSVDGGASAGVDLQITHMKAEIEDDEDVEDEKPDTRTPAEKIYGRR